MATYRIPEIPYIPTPVYGRGNPDVQLVADFATVMSRYSDDTVYSSKALQCAEYVKRPAPADVPPPSSGAPTVSTPRVARGNWSIIIPAISPINLPTSTYIIPPKPPAETSRAGKARANVLKFAEDVSAFIVKAKIARLVPPDDPFVQIAALNASQLNTPNRRGDISFLVSNDLASAILFNIRAYVDLLEALNQGAIDLGKGRFNVAQLQHVTLSYSGLGGSGNDAADLMKFLPSADEIKKRKAQEALSTLDFSKRVPALVFVADYSPNESDKNQGALVGWKKIPDAAGYIITRHAMIANTDKVFDVTAAQAKSNESLYMEYAKAYVLSFYDKIKPESVCLLMDSDLTPDDYLIYKVQAYQNRRSTSVSIIPSNFVKLNLNNQQRSNIQNRIKELDPTDVNQTGQETISPWPVFAEQIFGDATLDWVLAAANTRASIDRGDDVSVTRNYSYLNAHTSFLLRQADSGNLVRAASVDDVRRAVESSIQSYGITQTIESLLQDTGILYYFSQRDIWPDTTFDRAGTADKSTSGILGVIAGAIDPETATLDLKVLSTNLAAVLSDGVIEDYQTNIDPAASGTRRTDGAHPSEIQIDPTVNGNAADSGIHYLSMFENTSDTVVDLTTFDGIAKFIRVIRIMSDFGPNRIQPAAPPPAPVPTPVVAPVPTRPAPTFNIDAETVLGATSAQLRDLANQARAAGKYSIADQLERLADEKDAANRPAYDSSGGGE